MLSPVLVRPFRPNDAAEIANLFYETVHAVCAQDYSPEQLNAWARPDIPLDRWIERAQSRLTLVAEMGSQIVGFAELEGSDHIDCFYVHKDFQRSGVGSALMVELWKTAAMAGATLLKAEVSITALPFFERHGFVVVAGQRVTVGSVAFDNYLMSKDLRAFS